MSARSAFLPVIPFVAFVFASSGASSQVPDTDTLTTIVVSATKTPQMRSSLTQAVTILKGEELRLRGISRVVDALHLVPGAALVQNGSPGSVTSLFFRGGESRYTKVLIDGIAVNAPGGYFDFSHLTTDNIDRIEVVRGPASVVYGADAISGIVRIFTRQGRGPLAIHADGRAGTYGTREGALEVSGGAPRVRYSVGGGAHTTDGILSFNNDYYNGTLSGSAGVTPRDGSDALLTARYTAAEFHYPTDYTGAPVDSDSYRVQHRLTVGLDATTRLARGLKARLLLGTNDVSDLTEDADRVIAPGGAGSTRRFASRARNKRRTAEGGVVIDVAPSSTLNIGLEYLNERERSSDEAGPVGAQGTPTSTFSAERHNTALYSELIGAFGPRVAYTVAARRDDNSDYDAFTTYRVGTSIAIAASSRIRASLSTAFNAPAFNQLRPTLYTKGSPDLSPERTRSWELGLEQSLVASVLTVSASYFNQRFSDLIQYVPGGPPNFLGNYANLTEAEANGYEAEVAWRPDQAWSAVAGYTYVNPRVTKVSSSYSGDLKAGQALLRRPSHSANATVAWSRRSVDGISATVSYVGKRPDLDFVEFPSPTVTLPAYAKLDLAASREVFRDASRRHSVGVTVRVDNAFDKKYEDVLHFRAPGRVLLVGARYTGSL
ncbi:MAG TPA: TonB-dependent receptor [Gemmatimonadaceae bacterium]|nr:TonB-dependent receptor [Gemmatimonadaceae bacterium]